MGVRSLCRYSYVKQILNEDNKLVSEVKVYAWQQGTGKSVGLDVTNIVPVLADNQYR